MRKDVSDKKAPFGDSPRSDTAESPNGGVAAPSVGEAVLTWVRKWCGADDRDWRVPLAEMEAIVDYAADAMFKPLNDLRVEGELREDAGRRFAAIMREWALISPLLHDAAMPGEDGAATAARLLASEHGIEAAELRKARFELLLAQRPCDNGSIAATAVRLRTYDANTFTAVTVLAQQSLVDLDGPGGAGSLLAAVKRLTSRTAGAVAKDATEALKTVAEIERVLGRWRERGAASQPSTVELATQLSAQVECHKSVDAILERVAQDGESILATLRRLVAVEVDGDPAEQLAEVRDLLVDHLACEETVPHCVERLVTSFADMARLDAENVGTAAARGELVQVLPDGTVRPVFPPAQVTATDVAVLAECVAQLADYHAHAIASEGSANKWLERRDRALKMAERLLARPPAPADDPHRKRDMFPPRCGMPTCGLVVGHAGECDHSFPDKEA